MFDLYLTGGYVPFTIALALLFALLALELLLAIIGVSLLGMGADADIDVDFDTPDFGDLEVDIGDVDLGDFDMADLDVDMDADADVETGAPDLIMGPAAWLGMGKTPMLIWLAAVLLGFGVTGLIIQSVAGTVFGPFPASVAAIPAAIAAIWFARTFGAVFARLLPKTETTALSERHLGRRTGVVTTGTAKRGSPAEVRVTDQHGNMHYLRGEPVRDDEEIQAGTKVLVLRHRYDHGYRFVALGPAD